MSITPDMLRELALKEFLRGGLVEINFIQDARRLMKLAADEIERLQNATPDYISQDQHQDMARRAREVISEGEMP